MLNFLVKTFCFQHSHSSISIANETDRLGMRFTEIEIKKIFIVEISLEDISSELVRIMALDVFIPTPLS